MSLKTIRLELARTADHPEGDPRHGYEFSAPLDPGGRIDATAWKSQRQFCTVRRFSPGGDDEYGHLVHGPGRRWSFHYDIASEPQEDEPGYRFESHVFKPGEYVSLTEKDGETRTFRVVSLR
jgi:hypothetical protein